LYKGQTTAATQPSSYPKLLEGTGLQALFSHKNGSFIVHPLSVGQSLHLSAHVKSGQRTYFPTSQTLLLEPLLTLLTHVLSGQ